MLKRNLLLLAVCLTLFCGLMATESECMKKNPFLKQLSESIPLTVSIFESPSKTDIKHCESEWSAHGTCCNQDDLRGLFKLEDLLIQNSEEQLIKTFEEMRKAIEKSTDILLVDPTTYKHSKSSYHNMKFYHDIYSFSNFKEESNKCWKSMKQARSSAICSICSGRSETYFSKDKIILPEDTCNRVVEDCELFFIKLRSIVQRFPQVLNSYKDMDLINDDYRDFQIMEKELRTYCPPQVLLDAFAEYEEAKKQGKDIGLPAANVCSMILNIRKTPYIIQMNPNAIETVARETQAQLERKFLQTMSKLNINDQKSVAGVMEERQKGLDSLAAMHKNKLASIHAHHVQLNQHNHAVHLQQNHAITAHHQHLAYQFQLAHQNQKHALWAHYKYLLHQAAEDHNKRKAKIRRCFEESSSSRGRQYWNFHSYKGSVSENQCKLIFNSGKYDYRGGTGPYLQLEHYRYLGEQRKHQAWLANVNTEESTRFHNQLAAETHRFQLQLQAEKHRIGQAIAAEYSRYANEVKAESDRNAGEVATLQAAAANKIDELQKMKISRVSKVKENHKAKLTIVENEKETNLKRWEKIVAQRAEREKIKKAAMEARIKKLEAIRQKKKRRDMQPRQRQGSLPATNWRKNTRQGRILKFEHDEKSIPDISSINGGLSLGHAFHHSSVFASDSLIFIKPGKTARVDDMVVSAPGIYHPDGLNKHRAANMSLHFP